MAERTDYEEAIYLLSSGRLDEKYVRLLNDPRYPALVLAYEVLINAYWESEGTEQADVKLLELMKRWYRGEPLEELLKEDPVEIAEGLRHYMQFVQSPCGPVDYETRLAPYTVDDCMTVNDALRFVFSKPPKYFQEKCRDPLLQEIAFRMAAAIEQGE